MISLHSILVFCLIFTLYSCNNPDREQVTETENKETVEQKEVLTDTTSKDQIVQQILPASANVQVKTFKNSSPDHPEGYGYDILMDGRLYIHQAHIPAIAGNKAFLSEADANKAATLVANKIRKNIMPPSITTEELDSLGVMIE